MSGVCVVVVFFAELFGRTVTVSVGSGHGSRRRSPHLALFTKRYLSLFRTFANLMKVWLSPVSIHWIMPNFHAIVSATHSRHVRRDAHTSVQSELQLLLYMITVGMINWYWLLQIRTKKRALGTLPLHRLPSLHKRRAPPKGRTRQVGYSLYDRGGPRWPRFRWVVGRGGRRW